MVESDKQYMEMAVEQGIMASKAGDYPVGAVLILNNEILSKQGNRNIRDANPSAHAEWLCIDDYTRRKGLKNLPPGCILYSTHEPCPMCASFAVWAKLSSMVFGATIEDMIAFRTNHQSKLNGLRWQTIDIKCREVFASSEYGREIKLIEEFMREECLKLFYLNLA